jgi:hypothetical protein
VPNLSCEISQSLMNSLVTRVRTTGEPLNHIVMRALADHLAVQHATLFQVSTAGALVEGISQGVVTVGELRPWRPRPRHLCRSRWRDGRCRWAFLASSGSRCNP